MLRLHHLVPQVQKMALVYIVLVFRGDIAVLLTIS